MAKVKKQTKSQARMRYEEKRPTKSFRTDAELDERIKTIQKDEGLSVAGIVRIGVEKLELRHRSEEEIRGRGYQEGYLAAKAKYAVSYRCAECNKMLAITTDAEKKAAAQYMRENGWKHKDCG